MKVICKRKTLGKAPMIDGCMVEGGLAPQNDPMMGLVCDKMSMEGDQKKLLVFLHFCIF
jgi:hypothetical protein